MIDPEYRLYDVPVVASKKCPKHSRYQAIGYLIETSEHEVKVRNAVDGDIWFPFHWLDVDKVKYLEYKLTGVHPYAD